MLQENAPSWQCVVWMDKRTNVSLIHMHDHTNHNLLNITSETFSCDLTPLAILSCLAWLNANDKQTSYWMCETLKEQDKSSDIEQQPPFGDRKISNIQPQNTGGAAKPTGTSYNFDKMWSGAPDGWPLLPSIHHMRNMRDNFLAILCTCLKNILNYIYVNINFDFW